MIHNQHIGKQISLLSYGKDFTRSNYYSKLEECPNNIYQ